MNYQRIEQLLTTIDRLGMVKIKHLLSIHNDLRSYRNACRVIRQLEPYIHSTYFEREKIIYLNKEGRKLIGSTKEVKRTPLIAHTLLRNEAYIYLGCPIDWKTEYPLETKQLVLSNLQIIIEGAHLKGQKKVIADAVFNRNGYFNIIEIDNTRNMVDNKKKIDLYREIMPDLKVPKLWFFTISEDRKKKLEKMMGGIRGEVKTFSDIK